MELSALRARSVWQSVAPGVVLCCTVGLAAQFLSQEYGAPVMLMALLLGSAFNFLAQDSRFEVGLHFCGKRLLRAAVALLGLQVSVEQVRSLGLGSALSVGVAVVATIVVGVLLSKLLRQSRAFGLLSGGAVAICGASAALAIASAMPEGKLRDRELLLTVVAVTSLSTVAMVFYPVLCGLIGLDEAAAGFFLGATIHDVAQVVGAGYSYSESAGDVAVFTKMLRVSLLIPIVVIIGLVTRRASSRKRGAPIPLFLVIFSLLFVLNSLVQLPALLLDGLSTLSRVLLVLAITSLGVQTSLQQLAGCGWRPMMLILLETLFIAMFVMLYLSYGPAFGTS